MKINKAYKFRIYPNDKQKILTNKKNEYGGDHRNLSLWRSQDTESMKQKKEIMRFLNEFSLENLSLF